MGRYGSSIEMKKAQEKRKREFITWTKSKETGKDRWKIIWEGCLIQCGGGTADGRLVFPLLERERTAKSN